MENREKKITRNGRKADEEHARRGSRLCSCFCLQAFQVEGRIGSQLRSQSRE